jgi:signal transduction histidine kinase
VSTLLRAPWTARAWINTASLAAGFLVAAVAATVIISLVSAVILLAVTAVLALPFLDATFRCSRLFTSWHRSRLRGLLGVDIPTIDDGHDEGPWPRRLWAQSRRRTTWRAVAYHSLTLVTSSVLFAVVVVCWTMGALLTAAPAYAWALPGRALAGYPFDSAGTLVVLVLAGLVLFFAAPWLAAVGTRTDVALARSMLLPSHTEQLARRVVSLQESRADLLEASDSERSRIERDLHDGTQQRLVSLAMNLGMTRTTLTDVPPHVREAIAQAHEEAKLALTELRDVVRGLHPAVLDDLGLDAALSGIAARSAVPVRLLVELPRRPPRAIERVAYFVVSETLTNVARHAHATIVNIIVELENDQLRIIIFDDGRGGADPSRGTGLRGLNQRIRSVDGSMTIDSPPDGPTLITVELPCAS